MSKILVIEDEEPVRTNLSELLEVERGQLASQVQRFAALVDGESVHTTPEMGVTLQLLSHDGAEFGPVRRCGDGVGGEGRIHSNPPGCDFRNMTARFKLSN